MVALKRPENTGEWGQAAEPQFLGSDSDATLSSETLGKFFTLLKPRSLGTFMWKTKVMVIHLTRQLEGTSKLVPENTS